MDDQTGGGGVSLPNCANGEMMVHDGSDFKCKKAPLDKKCPLPADPGKTLLQGFDSSGDPICVAAPTPNNIDPTDWVVGEVDIRGCVLATRGPVGNVINNVSWKQYFSVEKSIAVRFPRWLFPDWNDDELQTKSGTEANLVY